MDKLVKYKPLVWAKIEFWFDREVLYWEGDVKEFEKILFNDYIIFSRHNKRRVPTSKIKDFAQVESDDTEKSLEFKLITLTETQKQKVKDRVTAIKKNLGREATDKEVDRVILSIARPDILEAEKKAEEDKNKPLTKEQRLRTYLLIRKQKISKIVTGSYIWLKQ